MTDINDEVKLETFVVPQLGGTPYYGFAVQVHAALLDAGQSTPHDPMVEPGDSAIVARVGDQTVGMISYRAYIPNRSLLVCLAFVLPDWRRRGIFGHMFAGVIKAAERAGCPRIQAVSMVNNVAFNKVAAASGVRAVATVYQMDLDV